MNELTKKEKIALEILNGLMPHYAEDSSSGRAVILNRQQLIVKEAFDIATEFMIESSERG
jgi:hypothetical protein